MTNDLGAQFEKTKNIKSATFADDLAIWISLPKRQERQLSQIMNETLTALSNRCNKKPWQ
jgi:hypothetical protein